MTNGAPVRRPVLSRAMLQIRPSSLGHLLPEDIQSRFDIAIIIQRIRSTTTITCASRFASGDFDIRLDSNLAIGLPAWRVELGSRQPEPGFSVTWQDTLHRPLAIGLASHDRPTVMIMNRSRDDFTGTGTVAIGQQH